MSDAEVVADAVGDVIYDVLCYGALSMDNITRLDHLPTPRREAVASFEYNELGGATLQVAISLATWGLRVLVVGNVIGADWRADFIVQELARHPGIDARYIERQPGAVTPFVRTLVTPDGEPSRISYWLDKVSKAPLTERVMRQARLLSVDDGGAAECGAAEVARALSRPVISADVIDPGCALAVSSDAIVISSSWLLLNYPDAFEYDHALDLQAQGAGAIILTDGARPVLVVREDGSAFGIEPYRITDVIDTSGAGHLFKAGLIYGWLQPDWPLEQRVKFACAAAGLYCQRDEGNAVPSLAQIAALMAAQPR